MQRKLTSLVMLMVLSACSAQSGDSQQEKSVSKASPDIGDYSSQAPLQIEEIGLSDVLPDTYPDSWVFAHNMNFYSIVDGNIALIDAAADSDEYKGILTAGQFATFAQSKSRKELYVAETFLSRGTRGEEIDVVTVYDSRSLNVIDELVLPGAKRAQSVTQKGAFQLIDNERLGLIFNFTPASSVTVLDLENRNILTEIPTPGCALTFALQGSAFGSLCGNGTIASFKIDGKTVEQTSSEVFNDIDNDAMFLKSVQIDKTRFFPTFTGNVRPVDVSTQTATPLPPWSLVTKSEREANWRPSGWQVVTADNNGNLYVLMDKGVIEGGHKSGGTQVWVYDPKTKKKVSEIKLRNGGLSIEVVGGDEGLLVVTNAEMKLDVYSLDGALQRTILVSDVATPFVLHATK